MVKRVLKVAVESRNPLIKKIRAVILTIPSARKIGSRILWSSEMDDLSYIKMRYKEAFGCEPNLTNPQNFNEKSNWRKLYDRREIYTQMVDKYTIKGIIEQRVGKEHAFKLLGVWDDPSNIDFSKLPDKFVLKPNHSGGVIVCRDRTSFDAKRAIAELKRALSKDYYPISREWPYKNVVKKVIAEEYMGENLIDYKNYCFNGKLHYTFVWQNHSREDGTKPEAHFCGAYDREWKKTTLEIDYPTDDIIVEKPEGYDEMVVVAEKMSTGIPFVRVDCYIIDKKVYVGEMTFFPWGGFQRFKDEKWNNYLGELEKLPTIDY